MEQPRTAGAGCVTPPSPRPAHPLRLPVEVAGAVQHVVAQHDGHKDARDDDVAQAQHGELSLAVHCGRGGRVCIWEVVLRGCRWGAGVHVGGRAGLMGSKPGIAGQGCGARHLAKPSGTRWVPQQLRGTAGHPSCLRCPHTRRVPGAGEQQLDGGIKVLGHRHHDRGGKHPENVCNLRKGSGTKL